MREDWEGEGGDRVHRLQPHGHMQSASLASTMINVASFPYSHVSDYHTDLIRFHRLVKLAVSTNAGFGLHLERCEIHFISEPSSF